MLVRKVRNTVSTKPYQTRLEYLYARRSAIDGLIDSLEQYAKCRARRMAGLKVKAA